MNWALGFLLGVLATLLAGFVFDPHLFRSRRKRSENPMKEAISRRLSRGPVIVAVGGGTGLSTLLRGMKAFTRNITAVVAVTDEGGSSGRLRMEWGVLPPGDVRNCMVALAENDNALKQLLNFRFDRGELAGHSLGNLFLLAISELCGDFRLAVEHMNHLLAIRGRVLPVTTEAITLVGLTRDEEEVRGELDISRYGRELKAIWLEPQDAQPLPDVLRAATGADLIVLGPGSLFTSVLPNLLLPEFASRLRDAPAPKVYISNLMTQPEETEGMSLLEHIEWVTSALGTVPDCVVANNEPIPEDIVAAYRQDGAAPLYLSPRARERLRGLGCRTIEAPLVQTTEDRLVRHDPLKLAALLFRLCRNLERE
ncbi:MAG: uridine diphosphate-N-acetylglucosamine-binding protein YvcK [Fretibacterium sp.]|nr:uridine diphosphate-N-acetylglucosamine-binding protein YvcK [Fretibacterium sp.]